ncbi:hypothetical protein QUF90_10390 [Desulfococcaceae bacterium HSG9]|nr:hypothetical protein [Desulfococcaceae bacterium HSG9]
MTVPEGLPPTSRPDNGGRPSGTGIKFMPVFPPINRWAIGVPPRQGQKKPTPEMDGVSDAGWV